MKKTIKLSTIALICLLLGSATACTEGIMGGSGEATNGGDPECHREMTEFGDVEIFGSFANDLGCMYDVMKIDGKKYDYSDGTKILAKRFVKSGDSEKLVRLIDKIHLQHSDLMTRADDSFTEENKTFTVPKIVKVGSGYKLTAWIREGAQMIPVDEYDLVNYTISVKGVITGKILESFSHDL